MPIYPNRFKKQVAVVTGAADGIGKAIAMRLGLEGAFVALLDNNENKVLETEVEFQKAGILCKAYTVDISNEQEVEKTIDKIIRNSKKIDVLVHSAGIVGPTGTNIISYSTEDFDKVYAVNLRGSYLVTKHVLKFMLNRNYGRILLVASIAGKEGNPGMVGYSSTKAGVIGLVKGVAKEFASKGILINGIAPAVIRTAMNEDTTEEQLLYMVSKIPMNRLGTVEEVSALSSYIVSEENSFSTGFIYDISGGRATY